METAVLCISLAHKGGQLKYISPPIHHTKALWLCRYPAFYLSLNSHPNHSEICITSTLSFEKAQIYFPLYDILLNALHATRDTELSSEFPLIFKMQPISLLSNQCLLSLFLISQGALSSWEWECGYWWTPQGSGKLQQPTPCYSPASTSSWAWEACSFFWAFSAAVELSVKTSACSSW